MVLEGEQLGAVAKFLWALFLKKSHQKNLKSHQIVQESGQELADFPKFFHQGEVSRFVIVVPTGTKTKTWPHQQYLLTHSVDVDAAHKYWANG